MAYSHNQERILRKCNDRADWIPSAAYLNTSKHSRVRDASLIWRFVLQHNSTRQRIIVQKLQSQTAEFEPYECHGAKVYIKPQRQIFRDKTDPDVVRKLEDLEMIRDTLSNGGDLHVRSDQLEGSSRPFWLRNITFGKRKRSGVAIADMYYC